MRSMTRWVAAAFLVAGIVGGILLFGDGGAMVGVVVAMIGFQGLTRGVEGVPYVAAATATTAGLIAIAWKHGLSATELGLGLSTWAVGLAWSAAIVVVTGIVVGIAGGIPRLRKLFADDRVTDVSGVTTARRALLDIPFGTVLVEEFAFRSVMFALAVGVWGTTTAIVVTSVLFGLWHISPSLEMHEAHAHTSGSPIPTILSTILVTGLGGVGFALLRVWTGSLFPPAALHWAMNGSGVVVGWIVHRTREVVHLEEPPADHAHHHHHADGTHTADTPRPGHPGNPGNPAAEDPRSA